jgi:hypothetical protein
MYRSDKREPPPLRIQEYPREGVLHERGSVYVIAMETLVTSRLRYHDGLTAVTDLTRRLAPVAAIPPTPDTLSRRTIRRFGPISLEVLDHFEETGGRRIARN